MAVLTANTMVELQREQKDIHSFFGLPPARISYEPLNTVGQTSREVPSTTPGTAYKEIPYALTEEPHLVAPGTQTQGHDNVPTLVNNRQFQRDEIHDGDRKRQKLFPAETTSEFNCLANHSIPEIVAGPSDVASDGAESNPHPFEEPRTYISIYNVEPRPPQNSSCTVNNYSENPPLDSSVSTEPVVAARGESSTTSKRSPSRTTKLLQFNPKTGTIGSPPPRKPKAPKSSTDTKATHSKRGRKSRSLVVKLSYGSDAPSQQELGLSIDSILRGEQRQDMSQSLKSQAVAKKVKPKNNKSTHPFFGKVIPDAKTNSSLPAIAKDSCSTVADSTTKVKPSFFSPSKVARFRAERLPTPSNPCAKFHTFGNSAKLVKFPGSAEPIWPPKDMVHIRHLPANEANEHQNNSSVPSKKQRKSKHIAIDTVLEEDIISALIEKLRIPEILDDVRSIDNAQYQLPDKRIRIPARHFETGKELQQRIKPQLRTLLPPIANQDLNGDDLHTSSKPVRKVHPAISRLFDNLSTSLSAFDRSQYETHMWTQKYAPVTAADVLQTGREAFILKDWLQALTVLSVDSVSADSGQTMPSSSQSKRTNMLKTDTRPKKKRKSKLDDFVVGSDEEDELTEVSDSEDLPPRGSQHSKRTVVRAGSAAANATIGFGKVSNAVVISGPSGSHKTAMVYAVAKELGFEIFEINSGSRRSGKDILDKVGDMTRNHLVQGPRGGDSKDGNDGLVGTAVVAEHGRQGVLKSFFQPKVAPAAKTASEKHEANNIATPKQQKQSLILLEEADILYEDDKQFWATVMTLMIQSKRPIIMTCNDESVLPLQALSLHAIIRLASPPSDIAVDYALLVASNEGHVLEREAVDTLYRSRNCDLRASLTELQAWCQMGVGDRRGGMDWFFPRWPIGCDKDENGDTIRVVSETTYRPRMGWLSDELDSDGVLREAWDQWQIDPFTAPSTLDSLDSHAAVLDLLSFADACSSRLLVDGIEVPIDTTNPEMSERARNDYIIGYQLLQADVTACHSTLAKDITLSMVASTKAQNKVSLKDEIFNKITNTVHEVGGICRRDFSIAFDPIAEPERYPWAVSTSLEPSVFDRNMSIISLDVAPYVRSIVACDTKLQRERVKLSNLLSEGGKPGKRMRTTRSALSALEGGTRKTVRKERYFEASLNTELVMRTGAESWQAAAELEISNTSLDTIA